MKSSHAILKIYSRGMSGATENEHRTSLAPRGQGGSAVSVSLRAIAWFKQKRYLSWWFVTEALWLLGRVDST